MRLLAADKSHKVVIALFSLCLTLGVGCQTTPSITFQAKTDEGTVNAMLMDFGSRNTPGKDLGKLPVTLEYEQIAGKLLQLSKKEGESQYWFFPELAGSNNKAIVSFGRPPSGEPGSNNKEQGGSPGQGVSENNPQRRNLITRLLLKSYQALSGKKFAMAVQLADQAQALDPVLAGPYLIKGLAQIQLGERAAAKVSLTQARTLDPEDRDLDILLKAVQ